jgi:acetyl esterase
VARQSTRLTCAAVHNGQSSYDPRFAEKIGLPRPNFERHPFFFPFYGIQRDEIDSPRAHKLYDEAAAITHLTADDPPVYLSYSFADEPCDAKSSINLVVHHPRFGIALKEQMDALGIECVVRYRDQPGATPPTALEFIRKQFARARQQHDAR